MHEFLTCCLLFVRIFCLAAWGIAGMQFATLMIALKEKVKNMGDDGDWWKKEPKQDP